MSLLNIQMFISGNFFSIYITQYLLIPEASLAYFSILRAAIMLVFFFFAQNRLAEMSIYKVMLAGLGLYIGAYVLLLNIPSGMIILLAVYTAMNACASALFLPRRDVLVVQNVDPVERPRITSLLMVIMLGITSPFGALVGLLFDYNSRLPFIVNVILFILMGGLVAYEKYQKEKKGGFV